MKYKLPSFILMFTFFVGCGQSHNNSAWLESVRLFQENTKTFLSETNHLVVTNIDRITWRVLRDESNNITSIKTYITKRSGQVGLDEEEIISTYHFGDQVRIQGHPSIFLSSREDLATDRQNLPLMIKVLQIERINGNYIYGRIQVVPQIWIAKVNTALEDGEETLTNVTLEQKTEGFFMLRSEDVQLHFAQALLDDHYDENHIPTHVSHFTTLLLGDGQIKTIEGSIGLSEQIPQESLPTENSNSFQILP